MGQRVLGVKAEYPLFSYAIGKYSVLFQIEGCQTFL